MPCRVMLRGNKQIMADINQAKSNGKWRLAVREEFSASHQLRHYAGRCEALHGHNFQVEVEVEGTRLHEKTGILMDFKALKNMLKEVMEPLDHCHLNDVPPFNEYNPSSEYLAKYLFQGMKGRLSEAGVRLVCVSVWEKQSSCATYSED